jgi:hypothetical protein
MTTGPQTTFVVEYPCDRFCHIEVDLSGEPDRATLQQMRAKADQLHQREHEPEQGASGEPVAEPVVDPDAVGRPAPTVFLSAPGRGNDRRR